MRVLDPHADLCERTSAPVRGARGTQVLVGKYDGDLRVLTHERDLFSTTIDNEQHYLSQWTFVIGKVILQVFADPWRDTAPSSRTRRRTL